MSNSSHALKGELEGFRYSTGRVSDRINGVGEIWQDSNYVSLQTQIGELARNSKTVIESGDRACRSIDRFFVIAAEEV